MLLTKDIEALVIHIDWKEKQLLENEDYVWVRNRLKTGTNLYFGLSTKFGGLENMSLIPGNVGTTPVQNIGAWNRDQGYVCSCEALTINQEPKHS
jgi:UDP-N-acetylmuramate dehydrogenase